MTVFIGPVDSTDSPVSHDFFAFNPGLGGTDYRDYQMAQLLTSAGIPVKIVSRRKIESPGFSFPSTTLSDINDQISSDDVIICRSSALQELSQCLSREIKIVVVSHHPHDSALSLARTWSSVVSVVNVGEYQFWSNWRSRQKNILIHGFCPAPVSAKELNHLSTGKIGHISSLHPSKGFLQVARGFSRFSMKHPDHGVRLEVVGSLSLYGQEGLDPEIPTTKAHALEIRNTLRVSQVAYANTYFLGLQGRGLSAILSQWDAAVMNPLGLGESDPLSFHEVLAAGVPIVSGGFFGAHDMMRAMPRLRAWTARGISTRIHLLTSDPEFRRQQRFLALEKANQDFDRNQVSSSKWLELIRVISNEGELPKQYRRVLFARDLILPLLLGFAGEFLVFVRDAAFSFSERVRRSYTKACRKLQTLALDGSE